MGRLFRGGLFFFESVMSAMRTKPTLDDWLRMAALLVPQARRRTAGGMLAIARAAKTIGALLLKRTLAKRFSHLFHLYIAAFEVFISIERSLKL